MYSQDARVRDILEDYLKEERKLKQKIEDCIGKHSNIKPDNCIEDDNEGMKHPEGITSCRNNSLESETRNQQFLKDLEEAKARLRTIASFTPTDQELRVLAGAYRGLLGNLGRSL